jgi:membrane protease subunit HflC
MKIFLILLATLAILTVIVLPNGLYVVQETEFVVITQFGEIRRVTKDPGLHVKKPFIESANVLDKRALRIDVPRQSMADQDNQFLEVDAYVRYRIVNPQKFLEKLQNEITAGSRIGAIVSAQLRARIGQSTQEDIIGGRLTGIAEDRTVVEPTLTANGTPTREAIIQAVRVESQEIVNATENDFGVDIVDVRIKRADFPEATEENIFNRMRTERAVQAQKLRAEGEEDFRTRTADVDRQVEVISATADEEANRLRGEGEGEAIATLAEALSQDEELFTFLRSLEAYSNILGENTTAVLPSDSPLFKFLQDPSKR